MPQPHTTTIVFNDQGEIDDAAARSLLALPRWAGVVSLLLGLLVLTGWAFDIDTLRSVLPGLITMKPNTALGFIASGAALIVSQRRAYQWLTSALGVLVGLTGLLTVAEYAFDLQLGIDELLFIDHDHVGYPHPGRMSPASALCFALLGGCLIVPTRKHSDGVRGVSILVVSIALLAMVGYLYSVSPLYLLASWTAMALHTAFGLSIVGVGLFASATSPMTSRLVRRHADGPLLRRFLIAAVLIPPALGVIAQAGQRLDLWDQAGAMASLTLGMIATFVVVCLRTARAVQRSDEGRRSAVNESIQHLQWFEATLMSVGDAVIATDEDGRVLFLNPVAEQLTGWEAAQAEGRPLVDVFQIFSETTGEPKTPGIDRVLREGVSVELGDHTVLEHKRGGRVPIDDNGAPIMSPEGDITGAVLVFRDVTERRDATQALEAAADHKDEFLAMLGHELRNPLAVIVNAVTLLRHKGSDAASAQGMATRATDAIGRQTQHMRRLIDDLLDVSRISRGKLQLQRISLDAVAAIDVAVTDGHTAADKKGVTLDPHLPDRSLWIEADETRFHQIVQNLLSNAIKFTPRGGSVTVTVSERAGELIVEIRDTGAGIEPDALRSIFDPFHQAPQGLARSVGGLGLGLAIVRGLVERHGGSVWADSEGLDQGTTVSFALPLAKPPEAATRRPEPQTSAALRVLIIEDNIDAAELLVQLLEFDGHIVRAAADGHAGVEAATAFEPDLVLCDIGLPGGMSGMDVARRLREQPKLRDTTLIAVTGYGDPETRATAEASGFEDLVIKPLDRTSLRRVINRAATRERDAPQA